VNAIRPSVRLREWSRTESARTLGLRACPTVRPCTAGHGRKGGGDFAVRPCPLLKGRTDSQARQGAASTTNNTAKPPRLPAYLCDDGAQVRVWCRFCDCWHYHGAGVLGHRAAPLPQRLAVQRDRLRAGPDPRKGRIGTLADSKACERRQVQAVWRAVVSLARCDSVQRSALPRPAVCLACGDECRSRRPPPSVRVHGHRAHRHGSRSAGAGHRSAVCAQAPTALALTRKSAPPLGIEPEAIPTARTAKEP